MVAFYAPSAFGHRKGLVTNVILFKKVLIAVVSESEQRLREAKSSVVEQISMKKMPRRKCWLISSYKEQLY